MRYKELITETPYLQNEQLGFKALSSISKRRLKDSYTKLADLDSLEGYQNTSNKGIIAGELIDDEFYIAVAVRVRERAWPVEPKQLDEYLQVAFVNADPAFKESGIAGLVYDVIARSYDLVSDHEQYLGGKWLWQSLARKSSVNVHIFDGRIDDYIRDKNGSPVKYNGRNIDKSKIWGNSEMFRTVLMVGTTKELK